MSNPLEAANQKLLELRAQAQALRLHGLAASISRLTTGVPLDHPGAADNLMTEDEAAPATSSSKPSWEMRNAIKRVSQMRNAQGIAPARQTLTIAPTEIRELAVTAVSTPLPIDGKADAKVWPGLAIALKRAGYAPHYRLYVAMQSLDATGSSAIEVPNVRGKYTNKTGSNGRFYLFTWRRVRQLLNAGDGVLWNWDRRTDRIYLRSAASIAKSGAVTLKGVGRAVMVPSSILFAGQGKFNAHMHAAWLSAHGDEAKPISQAAIEAATAVAERTQRHYNRVAGVQRQTNLAIGPKSSDETKQETAWAHGGSFEFIDYQGRQGQPNGRYQAWRLPDSYKRRHALAANGRRRKINQSLTNLVNNVERGCSGGERLTKRYHTNGGAAVTAFNRHPEHPVYWSSPGPAKHYSLWFSL